MAEQSARELQLGQIVASERSRLLATIRARIRDQVEAEDVLQEVFEEFVTNYDLGATIERVGAWLTAVAKNKIVDRFRRKKTQTDYIEQLLLEDEDSESGLDPAELGFLRSELVEAVGLLPPEQREVFIGHELEGKSFEQMSQETGVSLNTLLSRKRYAVLFLKDYLKEIYDELEQRNTD